MSTATKRKTPINLAISNDGGQIFIRVRDCGIEPLIVMIDCLPLVFFGKGKTAYLNVKTALAWFEKELPYDPNSKSKKAAIAKYRQILKEFSEGKTEFLPVEPPS